MLFGAAMLAACSDSASNSSTSDPASKLSKEEELVLDAMMFLFTGIEDNTEDKWGLTPWRREVKGRSIEFSELAKNGIFWDNEEQNRKMRQSTYMRYLRRITLKEPCVFHFEAIEEFSKGDSRKDFTSYSTTEYGGTHTFNLGNAHHFNLDVDTGWGAAIAMAGPRVECDQLGYCENAWNSGISGMHDGRFKGEDAENDRRLRAMELIKKACPGKPY
jgi:hypothetical protein